jgi:glutamate synthase domain-containing protein 2/ferredoxin
MLEALKSSPVINLNRDSRYHIAIHPAAPRNEVPLRLLLVRNDACFNCGICVDACVYGVHHRQEDLRMPLGTIDQQENVCRTCLRCVRECPKDALSVPQNPEFIQSGFGHWTAPVISALLKQAETGKVPVSGAGYNGKFAGPGFDGIWTDMSEIVRPTRDGIHGREYISTAIIVGSRPEAARRRVVHGGNGRDESRAYRVIELPVPFLFDLAELSPFHASVEKSIVAAAGRLKTLTFARLNEMQDSPMLVPVVQPAEIAQIKESIHQHWMIELQDGDGFNSAFHELKQHGNGTLLSVRIPFNADRALDLALQGAHVLHLMADATGDTPIGHVSHALRTVHLKLVDAGIRDRVTLIAGGFVAAAEHMPKTILCGADGVSLDLTLMVALQLWKGGDPSTNLDRFAVLDPEWGSRRIQNLMAAWRDQLLEILGAMGLREVRRLRGEVGRGLFYEELLREFQSVFGTAIEVPAKPVIPAELVPTIQAPSVSMERNFHNELSKFRVFVNQDCIHCAVCVDTCPFGVFQLPNGLNHLLPAKSSNCIGSACESKDFYCVPKCPTDAIRIELDPTFQGMGDPRWTADLLVSTYKQAETGELPESSFESEVGASDGGFDRIRLVSNVPRETAPPRSTDNHRTAIPLNRRKEGAQIWVPVPWYGGGMSYGSISLNVMVARAKAAKAFGTFMSTGEGGYPDALIPYSDHVITQLATGLFGVREDTIRRTRIVEFKYAQGAKPGLGGHLLADKVTAEVARMRGSMQWSSLFSPFPFHSVYSVEDHKKHLDWIRIVNPDALISVKVSTPSDVDMVAVGSYYAGANILQLDGSYGGTGAAPDIAKKNIATPIEFAIPKVHKFLIQEGIRDELVILASGGVRTPLDIIKSIALGADGVVVGTAELVAIECDRCTNCERGRGCPFGIATSDPELTPLIHPDWAAQRIINLFHSWQTRLIEYLDLLGVETILELRGRTDLLEYVTEEEPQMNTEKHR